MRDFVLKFLAHPFSVDCPMTGSEYLEKLEAGGYNFR